MNRYSNITTSDFNPLSLEEVLAVPLYKQKQYDALEEARIKQADMFKIDPLDVHKERAMELNNSYMSKVDELANYQARTGDIQGSKSRMIKLQREYKKLNDPMGEVSKTNAAKVAYNTEKARFLEAATKQYSSEQALKLWNDHSAKYTGFNDKNEITNIDSKGLVKAKDFDKELLAYHSLLGNINSEIGTSGNRIVDAGQGDGSKKMVNSSNRVVKSSNVDALNSMKKAMSADWLTPNGEGYKFNQEAGVDNAVFNAKFTNLMESQIQNTYKNIADSSASYIAAPKPTTSPEANTAAGFYGIDYNTNAVGGKNTQVNEIARIGKDKALQITPGSDNRPNAQSRVKSGGTYKYSEIKDPRQKAIFDNTWNNLTTKGVLGKDGKLHFLNAAARAKGKDDPRNAAYIAQTVIDSDPITLTTKLLTTDRDINNSGFAGMSLGKTQDARDKQMRRDLELTNSGARKLLDPETGQSMTYAEAQEKYGIAGSEKVKYQGYISPLNWEGKSFTGTDSKASPHLITIPLKDGSGTKEFKVSRIASDNLGVNIARYNDLETNYRNYTIQPNKTINFESQSPNLKGFKIHYNTVDPQVDPNRGVLNHTLTAPNGDVYKLNEYEYVDLINSMK